MNDARSTRPAPGSERPRTGKLASIVARRIEGDILTLGWPTGSMLGSEDELLERYGVSRAVLREAVRLIEHRQIAAMRRGPGGGLLVTEPDRSTVVDVMIVFISYLGVSLEQLFEARAFLEASTAEQVTARLTKTQRRELGEAGRRPAGQPGAEDPQDLHRVIAALTGNPAIELFCDVLTAVTALHVATLSPTPSASRAWRAEADDAHAAIVRAMAAGDTKLASHRMRQHLLALGAFLVERRSSRKFQPELLRSTGRERAKRAEVLAQEMFQDIVRRGWPVGEIIGSEPALMEEHQVSRAVLREAVRILEHHQIAAMRRGPGGGLAVTEPGVESILDATTLYLEFRHIEPIHLHEARSVLELATVELALGRLDDAGRDRLTAALAHEQGEPVDRIDQISHDLHLLIGELSGNPLLLLILRILIRLSERHIPPTDSGRDDLAKIAGAVHRAHGGIVDALLAGDVERARRRMLRHLDALLPWHR